MTGSARHRGLAGCGVVLLVCWVFAAGVMAQPADPLPTEAPVTSREIREAFASKNYAQAKELIERKLIERPRDPFLTYNLACALARLGEVDVAAERLVDAVSFGLSDLHHVERDPDLEAVRETELYRRLIHGWRAVLDRRGGAELEAAQEALGRAYVYEKDEALRLNHACAMNEEACESARHEIAKLVAWTEKEIGIPVHADESKPFPWVLVILPTPEDFLRYVGREGIGGYFDKDRNRLITQDIGPTLRHEFFHVLHWRHMDRMGQRHPFWVMEGLAALVEDVDEREDGTYLLAPSWRTNIAKRLEKAGRLTPWKTLFAMERDAFMTSRARANYAQARAIFMYMHERGVLRAWYGAYLEGFEEDPSGASAIETAFGEPLRDVEKKYRLWLRGLAEVSEIGRPGEAGLGVEVGAGTGDGPVVKGVVSMSAAKVVGEEKLRMRDVITAVGGRATRNLDDLYRILGDYEVGEIVELDVRRAGRFLQVKMELVPREALPPMP